MMRSSASRLKVLGPSLAAGAILAGLFASKLPEHAAELWLSIMAGPFAGLWAISTWRIADALVWAVVCLLAIMSHPLRAGLLTGSATVAGVGLWVLLGLMLTFDGV